MSNQTAFVVCLGLACLAFGILIGVLVMVCYRRVVCCVFSDRLLTQQPDRRASGFSMPGIQSVSGNHNLQRTISQFPVGSGHFGSAYDRFDLVNFDPSTERRTRNPSQVHHSNHLPPAHQNPEDLGHSINMRNGSSRKNDVNREHFQSSNRTVRSDTINGGSQDNASARHPDSGTVLYPSGNAEAIPMQVLNTHGYEYNTDNNNIKIPGNKLIPHGSMGPRRAFPPGEMVKEVHDNISDEMDVTAVKMFANCPDDIRTIFEPCVSSKTICLREKKIVYICKRLDEEGGLLELEHMGISLTVPRGAIPYKQHNLVSLVLNWDLNDNPHMERREALVSPVVYCGPHASTFDKPCLLKFKHCAYDTRFARVLTSQTDLYDAKNWQELDKNLEFEDREDEDMDEQSGVSLSVNECQVEVPHFSLFTCIMRSKHRSLKKWIQVAVFTHDVDCDLRHQEIRIYFLNKTPCALQWAIQNEASYDFSLACPDTTFLFMESGENMMVHLSYISEGWQAVAQGSEDSMRTVFFEQIWHGACPHTSMCFRKIDKRNPSISGAGIDSSIRFGDSNPDLKIDLNSTDAAQIEENMKEMTSLPREYSEINIALRLNQELCDNLCVPLNVLAHNIKVKISDTQVKVVHERIS